MTACVVLLAAQRLRAAAGRPGLFDDGLAPAPARPSPAPRSCHLLVELCLRPVFSVLCVSTGAHRAGGGTVRRELVGVWYDGRHTDRPRPTGHSLTKATRRAWSETPIRDIS